MTETSISLLSIFCGIIGANLFSVFSKKYKQGITASSICGVFGSVLCIKSFGRLGFDPISIMSEGTVDVLLLSINVLVALLGGVIAVFILTRISLKNNK